MLDLTARSLRLITYQIFTGKYSIFLAVHQHDRYVRGAMNNNEIILIALKILGLYILVQGLASLASSTGINGLSGFDNWSLYLGTFIYLIAGLILIFKTESISKLIFSPSENVVQKFDVSVDFQKGALRVIGIYVAIFALPSIIHIIGQMVQFELMHEDIPEYMRENPNFTVSLVSQSVRFLLGVFLALGPDQLIRGLSRFDQSIKKMDT
jgi:uncharacterized membrane protein